MEWDSKRFHQDTENGMQFTTYELSISGVFYLIFLDHGWLWVTGTMESETADKGGIMVCEITTQSQSTRTLGDKKLH